MSMGIGCRSGVQGSCSPCFHETVLPARSLCLDQTPVAFEPLYRLPPFLLPFLLISELMLRDTSVVSLSYLLCRAS